MPRAACLEQTYSSELWFEFLLPMPARDVPAIDVPGAPHVCANLSLGKAELVTGELWGSLAAMCASTGSHGRWVMPTHRMVPYPSGRQGSTKQG